MCVPVSCVSCAPDCFFWVDTNVLLENHNHVRFDEGDWNLRERYRSREVSRELKSEAQNLSPIMLLICYSITWFYCLWLLLVVCGLPSTWAELVYCYLCYLCDLLWLCSLCSFWAVTRGVVQSSVSVSRQIVSIARQLSCFCSMISMRFVVVCLDSFHVSVHVQSKVF